MTNIPLTFRTAPECVKLLLFCSNGNSYTISKQSDMCVCVYTHKHTHILHNIEPLGGQNKYIKKMEQQ